MPKLKYDKLSQNDRQKNWKKYRMDLNGYVYTVDGKMITWLGEGSYEKHKRKSPEKFDEMVEKYINTS